jgi:hypothetical protein
MSYKPGDLDHEKIRIATLGAVRFGETKPLHRQIPAHTEPEDMNPKPKKQTLTLKDASRHTDPKSLNRDLHPNAVTRDP